MALRLMLKGTSTIVRSSIQKTNPGLWPLRNLNPLHPPSSCCSSRHASSISSSICDGVKSPNGNAAVLGSGTSIYQGAQKDEWIMRLAKFAVSQQNENQNLKFNFVRVVGASHTGASSLLYHITLEATVDRKHQIYHAVVWLQLWKNLMELLVWKRVNDALSAVGVKRGDLQFHEAVMLHMNQMQKSFPMI